MLDGVTIGTSALHYNVLVVESYVQQFWITVASNDVVRLDWIKGYSIANWTVTESGATIDDYFYVDSGILYSSVDDGYIEANYDLVLSVSDTYSVYNLTTHGVAPEFSQYVSSWSSYSDVTRGATITGTITDIKLRFDANEIISAITFIEDGTAPTVVRSSSVPYDPEDDETVTLSAVVTDTVEVYTVYFDAIVYPAGFNDIAYYATERQDNLWTYSFSTLGNGYYVFKVVASDGANINDLDYYSYIEFDVEEGTIIINTYTLIGASSDFDYMHYSFHITHDCSFIIEEWSDTWAKNETHSGNVYEGDNAIAWDKIGVTDIDANYTITFTNGSLSLVVDGSYITAYKLLRITDIDFDNLESSDNWVTNLTINFYTNKDVSWYIYEVDNDDALLDSGTSVEGSDTLVWLKDTVRGQHDFAVKWTDGVTNVWFNRSYWMYDRNIDDLPGGGDLGVDERLTIQMWTTIGAVIGFVGLGMIALVYFKADEIKGLQLPNVKTQNDRS